MWVIRSEFHLSIRMKPKRRKAACRELESILVLEEKVDIKHNGTVLGKAVQLNKNRFFQSDQLQDQEEICWAKVQNLVVPQRLDILVLKYIVVIGFKQVNIQWK